MGGITLAAFLVGLPSVLVGGIGWIMVPDKSRANLHQGALYFWGFSGSLCYMEDAKGSGFTATGESSTGITGGPARNVKGPRLGTTWGVGPTWSNGTVLDQAGAFETENYGGAYGAGVTVSHGSGKTLDGEPEDTYTILVGPGGGITLSGGGSNTKILGYIEDPD